MHDVILDLYGRGEPADAVTVAAELTRNGDIAQGWRRALPAHADRLGADRGERGILRADRS